MDEETPAQPGTLIKYRTNTPDGDCFSLAVFSLSGKGKSLLFINTFQYEPEHVILFSLKTIKKQEEKR